MVIDRPPTCKLQEARTGNYVLIGVALLLYSYDVCLSATWMQSIFYVCMYMYLNLHNSVYHAAHGMVQLSIN